MERLPGNINSGINSIQVIFKMVRIDVAISGKSLEGEEKKRREGRKDKIKA